MNLHDLERKKDNISSDRYKNLLMVTQPHLTCSQMGYHSLDKLTAKLANWMGPMLSLPESLPSWDFTFCFRTKELLPFHINEVEKWRREKARKEKKLHCHWSYREVTAYHSEVNYNFHGYSLILHLQSCALCGQISN